MQKGFLEDSISSSNLTMMNNRNYSMRAESLQHRDSQHATMVQGSFNHSFHQPVQENILSESAEELFQ